jgi:hypothetical protein
LRGRAYTWSNEQNDPTFTRIDRFFRRNGIFCSLNIDLQALSTSGSDHAPLLLTGDVTRQNYSGFRFESYWVNMPVFYETVQAAWAQPVNTQDPILRMHVKLIRTAKALKMWRRQSLGNLPLAWKLRSDYSFLWMWNKNSGRFCKTSLFSDAILRPKQ